MAQFESHQFPGSQSLALVRSAQCSLYTGSRFNCLSNSPEWRSGSRGTRDLPGYGTVPASTPCTRNPEYYGTVLLLPRDPRPQLVDSHYAPVHETPEISDWLWSRYRSLCTGSRSLLDYGTVPETAPVHALPELGIGYKDEARVEKGAFNIEEQYTDELPQDARRIVTQVCRANIAIKRD